MPAFDRVEPAGSNIVTVRVGAAQSVRVHADRDLLRRVTTAVQAGTLVIANTPGTMRSGSPLHVEVGVPALSAVMLSGSGIVTATGLGAPTVTMSLPGSGVIRATGSAGRLAVTLDGSGDAELGALSARAVDAVVGGSGRTVVTASDSLRAAITGHGAITYFGRPAQLETSVTGSGTILRGTDP